jgi:hypothetical protein
VTERDKFLADLKALHETVVAAGRLYTAGEHVRAADLLIEVCVEARDIAADLRRVADAEPCT